MVRLLNPLGVAAVAVHPSWADRTRREPASVFEKSSSQSLALVLDQRSSPFEARGSERGCRFCVGGEAGKPGVAAVPSASWSADESSHGPVRRDGSPDFAEGPWRDLDPFSHLEMDGYGASKSIRKSSSGGEHFPAGQDGYVYRAERVRPVS